MPNTSTRAEHGLRVRWDGRTIAGVSKVSPLKRSIEVVQHRDGGAPQTTRKLPGLAYYPPFCIERIAPADDEFRTWANASLAASGAGGLAPFRKDVSIELYGEAGQRTATFVAHGCWVSEYAALPELDANGNGVLIESIVVQAEGWERTDSAPEPEEPDPD